MGEIPSHHTEWAVVDRLRTLLRESEDSEWSTTAAFAHLSALLCWVSQRVRGATHARGSRILNRLMKHNAGDAAWGLGEPFNTVSVADIFVALRDAVAHADERKISPINGAPDTADAGRLIGFEFHTEKFGGVPILESQMRTFGISLADEFLREMTPQKSKAA